MVFPVQCVYHPAHAGDDIDRLASKIWCALGAYLDGRVSAVIGTHTHVQTADERILPDGTAFITDAGMTGARDSVIGIRKELSIQRFLTQMPVRYEIAKKDPVLCGILVSVDETTGEAQKIERVMELGG